jgi:hypothetical protein
MNRSLIDWENTASVRRSNSALAWAAAACTALLALAIYVRTMAPTITLQHGGADSGDLVTAAINLGVPHPTGYPLYTIIAHLFTALPGGDPARNVTLLSALAVALAMAATFWAAHRLIAAQEGATGALPLAAAWTAAGVLAFGELLWSQATIAEVYSVNALLVASLLAVALSGAAPIRPYVLALLFGLGLAHHVTIVLLLPALWPYVPAIRQWLTVKRAFRVGCCLLVGLLAYLYIPIRAATQPVPNWGHADNLSGFLWLVSGAAYRQYLSALAPTHLLQRLSAWASIWVRDIGVLGLALALLGVWRGLETNRRFTLFGLTYVVLLSGYAMLYVTYDSYLYLIPAAITIALWMARGAIIALHGLQDWAKSAPRRRLVTAAAVLILVTLPVKSIITRFRDMDLSTDHEAYAFAENVLEAAAPNAIVVSDGDTQTFPLWYVRYGLKKRRDIIVVDRRLLAFDWYRDDMASQHAELAMLARTRGAREATAILVEDDRLQRPIHLTYSDDFLLDLAEWAYEDPVFTLLRK